jgi:hypothetical protein
MTIEQTVEIPADYRIFLELPRSVPIGVMARVAISVPFEDAGREDVVPLSIEQTDEMGDVRLLLQKEMAEQGTAAIAVTAGDGWEAHIRERYAEP